MIEGSHEVHIPVLVDETLAMLDLQPGFKIIDATVGLGGHAAQFIEKILPGGKLLAIDVDEENLKRAYRDLSSFGSVVILHHGNYTYIHSIAQHYNFVPCDVVFFDLGLCSTHVDSAERGFSFIRSGPLDMRFDRKQKFTAAHVINRYSFENLVRIFRNYGEEPYATVIARSIVKMRKIHPFMTTDQLVSVISGVKKRKEKIHPATKVFQALRIEVNQELDNLAQALTDSFTLLRSGGRIAVISYHSLEDRVVKHTFRAYERGCMCQSEAIMCCCEKKHILKVLTKKPIIPSEEEIQRNPRSRSAKLRVAERIAC